MTNSGILNTKNQQLINDYLVRNRDLRPEDIEEAFQESRTALADRFAGSVKSDGLLSHRLTVGGLTFLPGLPQDMDCLMGPSMGPVSRTRVPT